jgi:hypothetical protein
VLFESFVPEVRVEGLLLGHQRGNKAEMQLEREKPQLSGFSLTMASHWPPKGKPGSARLRDVKLRLRLVPVEPSSARRI